MSRKAVSPLLSAFALIVVVVARSSLAQPELNFRFEIPAAAAGSEFALTNTKLPGGDALRIVRIAKDDYLVELREPTGALRVYRSRPNASPIALPLSGVDLTSQSSLVYVPDWDAGIIVDSSGYVWRLFEGEPPRVVYQLTAGVTATGSMIYTVNARAEPRLVIATGDGIVRWFGPSIQLTNEAAFVVGTTIEIRDLGENVVELVTESGVRLTFDLSTGLVVDVLPASLAPPMAVVPDEQEVPLIFVPGIMASRLEHSSKVRVWPPYDYDQFKWSLLHATRDLRANPSSANPLFPAVYDEFIDHLLPSIGYRGYDFKDARNVACPLRSRNLFVFPYNWAQSNEASGRDLVRYIREHVLAYPRYRGLDHVDVVAHSMGGLVTRAALATDPSLIRRAAYIAVPHYGTPRAYQALHEEGVAMPLDQGWLMGAVGKFVWKHYVKGPTGASEKTFQAELRSLARNLDSMYELLPDQFYRRHICTADPTFGSTRRWNPDRAYNDAAAGGCNLPAALHPRVARGLGFKQTIGPEVRPDDSARRLIVWASDGETLTNLRVAGSFFPSFDWQVRAASGDETVIAQSASAWQDFDRHAQSEGPHTSINNKDIVNSARTILHLSSLLTDGVPECP